jgi:hypothetical protein
MITSAQVPQVEPEVPLSRRGVLWRAGLATAAGAAALTALDRRHADAATLEPLVLGVSNDAGATTTLNPTPETSSNPLLQIDGQTMDSTSTTLIVNGPAGSTAILAQGKSTDDAIGVVIAGTGEGQQDGINGTSGSGIGVQGNSASYIGVLGSSGSDYGVNGRSSSGVGVVGSSESGDGVHGTTATRSKVGVLGNDTSAGGGTGVSGVSAHGVGVRASSTSGTALSVSGKVHFSRSGSASVPQGSRARTVNVAGMTSSSLVLVTLQRAVSGVHVEGAVPASGKFTVQLNKAAPTAIRFAWFVVAG